MRNLINVVLCSSRWGRVAQKENRKFFGVGVDIFCNFPAEMKQTNQTIREKFTFVVSELVVSLLSRWFSALSTFYHSICMRLARIIGKLTSDCFGLEPGISETNARLI